MGTPAAAAKSYQPTSEAELEEQLRQAEEDFAYGDFSEITIDEIDRCIDVVEWPWRHASSG